MALYIEGHIKNPNKPRCHHTTGVIMLDWGYTGLNRLYMQITLIK